MQKLSDIIGMEAFGKLSEECYKVINAGGHLFLQLKEGSKLRARLGWGTSGVSEGEHMVTVDVFNTDLGTTNKLDSERFYFSQYLGPGVKFAKGPAKWSWVTPNADKTSMEDTAAPNMIPLVNDVLAYLSIWE